MIGLNEHGVWVGTTNLKTRRVQSGIGYMSLLHRAIRQRTRTDAAAAIEDATRMAAHTYWLADEHGGVELGALLDHRPCGGHSPTHRSCRRTMAAWRGA